MADGDVVAAAVALPRNAGPGAVTGGATSGPPRSAPGAATTAATGNPPGAGATAAALAFAQRAPAGPSHAADRRAAVVDLMRAHGDAVLGFCVRVLGDHQLAEEVRQQTFLEAFRDFDRVQDRSSLRAWLFGIASHRCLDALRNRQRRSKWIENDDQVVINTHDPGSGPSEQVAHAQLTSVLEDCLAALSPEVRMTVLVRFQTELTYEELAVRLATRADALQMRVTRALAKLRRCLETKGVHGD